MSDRVEDLKRRRQQLKGLQEELGRAERELATGVKMGLNVKKKVRETRKVLREEGVAQEWVYSKARLKSIVSFEELVELTSEVEKVETEDADIWSTHMGALKDSPVEYAVFKKKAPLNIAKSEL